MTARPDHSLKRMLRSIKQLGNRRLELFSARRKPGQQTAAMTASKRAQARLLAPVMALWLRHRDQILGWLRPLRAYYEMRTRREQILIVAAAVAFGLWMIYGLILTPYLEMRREVRAAYDEAYAEYLWLESQTPRLQELLTRRGVRRALIGDATRFVTERLGDAQVSVTNDGLYRITWTGDEGGPFFSVVNALVDYGAALDSIQFRRDDPRQRRATFVATIKY